mmetsp:Transcript_35129/g.100884  ORF Transcript_35129/g.100884 Transcript_35129/m.100884 type:complete len:379 (+) Transcript_35129:921-2057(+)
MLLLLVRLNLGLGLGARLLVPEVLPEALRDHGGGDRHEEQQQPEGQAPGHYAPRRGPRRGRTDVRSPREVHADRDGGDLYGPHGLRGLDGSDAAQLREGALPLVVEPPGVGVGAELDHLLCPAHRAIKLRQRPVGRLEVKGWASLARLARLARLADAAEQHRPSPDCAHRRLVSSEAVLGYLKGEGPQVNEAKQRRAYRLHALLHCVVDHVPDGALHELAVVDARDGAAAPARGARLRAEGLELGHRGAHVVAVPLDEALEAELPELRPCGAPGARGAAVQGVDVPEADGHGQRHLRASPAELCCLDGLQRHVDVVPVLGEEVRDADLPAGEAGELPLVAPQAGPDLPGLPPAQGRLGEHLLEDRVVSLPCVGLDSVA